jgi:DNA-binding CsgD family transcriptional regulator
MDGVGHLAADTGQSRLGARLSGAAEAVLDDMGFSAPRRLRMATRTGSGDPACAAEWEAGRTLPLEEAVAEALAVVESITTPHDLGTGLSGGERSGRGHEPLPVKPATRLTPREREVLRLLAEGRTDQQIATMLFISSNTVTTHVKHILAKLGVGSRTAAVAVALRQGMA